MPLFDNYYQPQDLLNLVDQEIRQVDPADFFGRSSPEHQTLRDAWGGAVFGCGYSHYLKSCDIKMTHGHNDASDFTVRVDGSAFPFQLTEAIAPERYRGKEFARLKREKEILLPYKPELGRIDGPGWISNSVENKIQKNYSNHQNLNLLVYANFDALPLERNEVLEALALFEGYFASIWIITSIHICSVFPNELLGEIDGWGEVPGLKELYFL